ncbi:MAG TPA: transcriptional regulator [Blastocatellia bacterium]|nr:transcriptional regulator [Blastocatellia bacterium]
MSDATVYTMSIVEIEKAIENLPAPELEELTLWLEAYRARRTAPAQVDAWFNCARGAARAGVTTDELMKLTRGDE